MGVVSLEERLEDGYRRYKATESHSESERLTLYACMRELENQIFEHCKIKPEDINDESIAAIMASLKDFVIQ